MVAGSCTVGLPQCINRHLYVKLTGTLVLNDILPEVQRYE